ncbi:unnamed protein product [Microthlaspi erraticum]|uniref:Uncharacterized protein n=1 Tax=Microthlaspi erraticum TaxID=1685480 RepID=A0A6D2IWB7_9BRAS|nr:unnamed protein product [Microthlaspi erraticum]
MTRLEIAPLLGLEERAGGTGGSWESRVEAFVSRSEGEKANSVLDLDLDLEDTYEEKDGGVSWREEREALF